MKKNIKNTLLKWVLGFGLLLTGFQSAFALDCEGTIYVRPPSSWTTVYLAGCGQFAEMTADASGWYTIVASEASGVCGTSFKFNNTGDWNGSWMNTTSTEAGQNDGTDFTCDDFGTGTALYVSYDPSDETKVTYGSNPPDAKYFYVMIPPDYEDWMSSVPMISTDGGMTGKALTADEDKCGWYYYVFFNEEISDNVVLVRDDELGSSEADLIGVNGNWETNSVATPIPLNTFFEAYGTDTLYFVPDESQFLSDGDDGWYTEYPEGVEGTCSYTIAAIIYDSDASLHPAFSCYSAGGEGCQYGAQGVSSTVAQAAVNACIGVTTGIVNDTLDRNVSQKLRKPTLTTKGETCFISEAYFNQLFNYTQGVNEKSCYDMPFSRSSDGKWEFDSDYYTSNGVTVQGGFYPVEQTTDEVILAADPTQTPVAAARTQRTAEGPVYYGTALRQNDETEDMPLIDILCNGPGWSGGYNCETQFADGDGTTSFVQDIYGTDVCVFGWSCENQAPAGWPKYVSGTETLSSSGTIRWTGERNQQFCFESHAKFTMKSGLKFNFRGDDDIWVFIDNKLAVDLGGTHLAAPGYVKLDDFEGLSGPLVTGNTYDLDIFFCDRRTTMSNVRIKTNMYIVQTSAIEANATRDATGAKTYEMCYTRTGDGSCASATSTEEDTEVRCCGEEITTKCGVEIKYYLVSGSTFNLDNAELLTNGAVNKGGIDLTNPTSPVVNKSSVSLPAGRWTLFAYVDGKYKKIESFRTTGTVEVMYATPTDVLDSNGDVIKGVSYKFEGSDLAGELLPIYITAIIADDASGAISLSPSDAVGVSYTLDADGLTLYENVNGVASQILASQSRTIGSTGVDTIYATVDFAAMTAQTQTFTIKVKNSSTQATLEFYLPYLSFADSAYTKTVSGQEPLEDGSYEENWVGSYYDLYVVAQTPTGAICEKCNFDLILGSETSDKIESQASAELKIEEGKGVVSIRSTKEYRYYEDGCVADATDPTDDCGPATVSVIAASNSIVKANYNPIYFREPPVPYPVLTDIFDAHGTVSDAEMNIPAPYYSSTQEYLDGIGDSATVYYNRQIHKDSMPSLICFLWDEGSAETLNPYTLGISNKASDSVMLCNDYVTGAALTCIDGPDAEGYCAARLDISSIKLSNSAKTSGSGKVYSWSKFLDKGKEVTQSFDGDLTDRMAPIILSARVTSAGDNMDRMVLEMSEPVASAQSSLISSSFIFYLNSATSLTEDARFTYDVSATDIGGDRSARITAIYSTNNSNNTPHVGDYIRFRGDIDDVYWKDTTNIYWDEYADIRPASDLTSYNWNAPTAYNSSVRLPSPWVPISGEAEVTVKEVAFAHTGNAAEGDDVPMVEVAAFATTKSFEDVSDSMNGVPGHFVQSDMNALINSDTIYYNYFTNHQDELSEIYFYYKVEYFTNLGAYVGGESGKIYCTDESVFGVGKNCLDAGRNFFIAWNMRSDEGRLVATGAYISKLKSYIKLGSTFGKKNSLDRTSVWGVRRAASTNK